MIRTTGGRPEPAAGEKAPVLETENLGAGYRGREIISGVSLELPGGSFSGIIGPNGCGKTTFFRAVTGLIPHRGRVRWWGRDAGPGLTPGLARRVAVVGPGEASPPGMSVREYILLGRTPHFAPLQFRETARDAEIADGAAARAGVEHLSGRAVSELSAGERQRAAIARALAQEPSALLLDEPNSHLDPGGQIDLMDLLGELHRKGLTVLVILHDLNLAAEYCERLFLFSGGTVAARGTPAETLTWRNIEEAYRTVVVTRTNPITGKPFVIPVPAAYRGGKKPGANA